jgi:hypothetical protein
MLKVTKGVMPDFYSIHRVTVKAYDAPVCFMEISPGSWSVRVGGDIGTQYFHGLTPLEAYQTALKYAH